MATGYLQCNDKEEAYLFGNSFNYLRNFQKYWPTGKQHYFIQLILPTLSSFTQTFYYLYPTLEKYVLSFLIKFYFFNTQISVESQTKREKMQDRIQSGEYVLRPTPVFQSKKLLFLHLSCALSPTQQLDCPLPILASLRPLLREHILINNMSFRVRLFRIHYLSFSLKKL